MSEKAEKICGAVLAAEILLSFLIVMAMESGNLRGVAAEIAAAVTLILQLTTILYIYAKARPRRGKDGTVGRKRP